MRSSLGDDEDQGDDVAVTCAALDDVRAACPFGRQCGVLTVTTGQPDIWADLGQTQGTCTVRRPHRGTLGEGIPRIRCGHARTCGRRPNCPRVDSFLADSAGPFESMGVPDARQSGDYTVVAVPLIFESRDAIGRVILDHDRKVAGLAWQYPRRRRLDPRRVQVFAVGNGSPEVAGALDARL
jgi:hypothetical protein